MAKKMIKPHSLGYREPVDGACVVCGRRVKSPRAIFCKGCGTVIVARRRSLYLTLQESALLAISAVIFNALLLKGSWTVVGPAIGVVACLMPLQMLSLAWRSANYRNSDLRLLTAAGGALILALGVAFVLDEAAFTGWFLLGAGLAISIGVHYPFRSTESPPNRPASSLGPGKRP